MKMWKCVFYSEWSGQMSFFKHFNNEDISLQAAWCGSVSWAVQRRRYYSAVCADLNKAVLCMSAGESQLFLSNGLFRPFFKRILFIFLSILVHFCAHSFCVNKADFLFRWMQSRQMWYLGFPTNTSRQFNLDQNSRILWLVWVRNACR